MLGEEEEEVMAEICPTCGLPQSICVCGTISREQQRVKIKLERRKWNKPTTVIEGLNGTKKDLQEIASKLKAALACGGVVKDGLILLQGDHRDKARETLLELGLSEENIEVI
ncbi:MAG: translation initiation factor [Candidatus Caldarchaeum sp.]